MKRILAAAVMISAAIAPMSAVAQSPLDGEPEKLPPGGDIERLFDLARPRISGESALELVAFMEPHWRLPGNSGYDASIRRVAEELESAGYEPREQAGPDDRFVYWIERRPMRRATWEPIEGALRISGHDEPLLELATNRNMIAINSASTPEGGVTAPLIDVGAGRELDELDVRGRIVMGEGQVWSLYRRAVTRGGAVGLLYYGLPEYNAPETHQDSITFRSIPSGLDDQGWAVLLSHRAHQALRAALSRGDVELGVELRTRRYRSEELTLIAEVRGAVEPDQRFVFSAHMQEPGANDNASGVAVQAEIARVAAALVREGRVDPARTLTFLWGDEISAIARYLREEPARTAGVRWGISLDMVGEDTAKTGGTFLIEKMPDPSAVWTRGDDRHTEWGSQPVSADALTPHYFNDFVIARCRDQALFAGWVVETNPFEGGSDHVPFLRAGKPGVLLWHFTDVYYHTDRDRLEMVSPVTMSNVGSSALVAAMALVSADESVARRVVRETLAAALTRMRREAELSRNALEAGADPGGQRRILEAWRDWYDGALASVEDVEVGGPSESITAEIAAARKQVDETAARLITTLRPDRVEPVNPGRH